MASRNGVSYTLMMGLEEFEGRRIDIGLWAIFVPMVYDYGNPNDQI